MQKVPSVPVSPSAAAVTRSGSGRRASRRPAPRSTAAQRRQPARVARGDEPDHRHQQARGVERRRCPCAGRTRRAPRSRSRRRCRRGSRRAPRASARSARAATALGDADRAVDRHPAHEPGVQELLLAAANLPDAFVRHAPVVAHPVDEPARAGSTGRRRPVSTVLVEHVDDVQQLAVDVELELVVGAVADAHRRGAPVALEVIENLLGQVVAAVDPVHDLQAAVGSRRLAERSSIQPMKARGLVGEAEPDRTRAVSEPSRIQV